MSGRTRPPLGHPPPGSGDDARAMGDRAIRCQTHGKTPATFACRHVATGTACGFHVGATRRDEPWPDAWCDRCDEAYRAEGGVWNVVSERGLELAVLCTHCYEAARERNTRVPPLSRGAAARLTDAEQAALVHRAVHDLQALQRATNTRWGFMDLARWDFDDARGTLTFTDPHRPSLLADVVHVGSYSTRSSTFQWAWATYGDGAREAEPSARLRVFGEVRGLDRLTTANWACDEVDGWEMAALAAHMLGAEAAYRAPFDHVHWFMLLRDLRRAR